MKILKMLHILEIPEILTELKILGTLGIASCKNLENPENLQGLPKIRISQKITLYFLNLSEKDVRTTHQTTYLGSAVSKPFLFTFQ